MQVELKPCPFCGETERLSVTHPFDEDDETALVDCDRCNAQGPYYGGSDSTSPEEAIAGWNRRVGDTQ